MPTAQAVSNMSQITVQLFIGYTDFCQTIASIAESLFANAQLLYRYFSYESRVLFTIFTNNYVLIIVRDLLPKMNILRDTGANTKVLKGLLSLQTVVEKARNFITNLFFKTRPEMVGAGNNLILSGIPKEPLERAESYSGIRISNDY